MHVDGVIVRGPGTSRARARRDAVNAGVKAGPRAQMPSDDPATRAFGGRRTFRGGFRAVVTRR